MRYPLVSIIIPVLNEEQAIGRVIADVPQHHIHEIVVVDNGSTDETVRVAAAAGAVVMHEPVRGYGRACLKGMDYLKQSTTPPDIVVFLDGDYSDYPEEIEWLLRPIRERGVDLVIGSRVLGDSVEKGTMTLPQIFGNKLAVLLLRLIYKVRFTDLGPFRAIRYTRLLELDMRDKTYGWTVEMQLKAAKKNMRCEEVPVQYRKRIGISKVSGTVKGVILAGFKIIYTLFRYVW